MRILHVVASRQRRGAEVFASSLVAALDRYGIEQRVAVLRAKGSDGVGFAAPIATLGDGKGLLPGGLHLEVGAVSRLRRLTRDFRPDVIQAHGGEPLKYVVASTGGRGRRVAYRRIGDSAQFRDSPVRERFFASLLRRTACVVAVAEVLREELVRRYRLDPAHVVTIPNGVDVSSVKPRRSRDEVRAELGLGSETSVVVSLGALTWEKDPLGHVDVVARAAEARPIMHAFVGDGALRSQLGRAISRRSPNYLPRLLGSRDDVGDLLAAADALLLASRTEGMPASVIEAGLAGLPVVGYALSGVPEVVVNGVTGRLERPGDGDALSRALVEVLEDPQAGRTMGFRARERCRALFDMEVIAPRYMRLYEEMTVA